MISIHPSKDYRLITQLNSVVQTWHHENYPDHFKPFDFDGISATIQSMLENPKVTVFVAVIAEKPCGYVLCIENHREENAFQHALRFLQVDQISVLPELQQSGVATELLKSAEALARQLNCTAIRLDHWQKNETAAAFFAKSGFTYFNQKMSKTL